MIQANYDQLAESVQKMIDGQEKLQCAVRSNSDSIRQLTQLFSMIVAPPPHMGQQMAHPQMMHQIPPPMAAHPDPRMMHGNGMPAGMIRYF